MGNTVPGSANTCWYLTCDLWFLLPCAFQYNLDAVCSYPWRSILHNLGLFSICFESSLIIDLQILSWTYFQLIRHPNFPWVQFLISLQFLWLCHLHFPNWGIQSSFDIAGWRVIHYQAELNVWLWTPPLLLYVLSSTCGFLIISPCHSFLTMPWQQISSLRLITHWSFYVCFTSLTPSWLSGFNFNICTLQLYIWLSARAFIISYVSVCSLMHILLLQR